MTCRGCERKFGHGWTVQSHISPALCVDCLIREFCYHGYHVPGATCLWSYAMEKKEAAHGRAS